ncbi:TetR family transcriptional regulator [Glaciihabitans arcticus]|uniref:TetR family transcriptional regulator n=1 Tax=Glaciihabitans arcticus TaxID=2668039 RepID=A0A4Q9GV27_9MICO|nr:TetR family transcriptional regulator [Glaciihabitans arcticus]TBN58074.1 TetR family transcriptional regulator [Glaciihabitans arcticus]
MARWEPDARARLANAALDLYLERGFEPTTVTDIAQRAGVTERTFFRHFADKREVLFDGTNALQEGVLEAIASATEGTAFDIAGSALVLGSAFLEERGEFAGRRTRAILANPELHERELLKLARLSSAIAGALQARGTPAMSARLAAEAAVAAFSAGFERWSSGVKSPALAECIEAALAEMREIVGG